MQKGGMSDKCGKYGTLPLDIHCLTPRKIQDNKLGQASLHKSELRDGLLSLHCSPVCVFFVSPDINMETLIWKGGRGEYLH